MTILYSNDFESGLTGLTLSGTTPPVQSSEQAYAGTYSCKSALDAVVGGVATDYRSESTNFVMSSTGTQYFAFNTVYRFGAAIYIPSDYHTTPDSQGDIVWQMHNAPFGTSAWTNPSWALLIANNNWQINRKTGTSADTTLIPVVKGAWTRLVMEFKLVDGSGGYFKLWINDVLVHDYVGDTSLTQFDGTNGYKPYIKLGLYCWVRKDPTNSAYPGTSTSAIVVYYDQIKVGDAASTYADVDPASGAGAGAEPVVTYLSLGDLAPINQRLVNGSISFASANLDTSAVPSEISGYSSGGQFGTGMSLNINTGSTSEIWAAITNSTTLDTENVLEVGIAQPHATEGNQRVQFGVSMTSAQVLKFRYKLWLHPDVALLKTYNGTYDWFAISSVFSDNTWSSTYPFVMSVDIAKQSATVPSDLKWRVRGRTYTYPGYSPNSDLWEYFSTESVETGKWLLVEHEIIDGNSSGGRYKIFVTPYGGTRTQVIDITNWTRHPSKPSGVGPTAFTPVKWYTGTSQIEHVRNLGGKLIAQFDDLQFLAASTDISWPTSEGTTITLKSGGTDPSTTETKITSINATDTIEPSVDENVVIGTVLDGVFEAEIYDSDTSTTVEALGYKSGTEARFLTDALVAISSPATVALHYAAPHYYDDNPRKPWADNGGSYYTESNYSTTVGPFSQGVTLTSNGNNAGKIAEPILTASSGDTIEAVFYYAAGTSPNLLAFVGRTGSLDRVQATGTRGSLTITSDTLSTGDAAVSEGVSEIWPDLRWVKLTFTIESGYTNQVFLGGLGAYTTTAGQTLHVLATRVWKNKSTGTITKSVTIPSLVPGGNPEPTITSIGSLTSGQEFTITGTGLKATAYLNISDGVTPNPEDEIYPSLTEIKQWKVNDAGTQITAVAPFGIPSSGAVIELTWSPTAAVEVTPQTWTDNAGGALGVSAYGINTWAGDAGAVIRSAGITWHRLGKNMIYGGNNDSIVAKINYIRGDSGAATFSIRNQNTGQTFAVSGPNDFFAIGNNGYGTSQSFSDVEIDGVRQMTMSLVSPSEGDLSVGIGPNSEFEDASIVVISAQMYSALDTQTISESVTVTSSAAKSIKFNATTGKLRRAGSLYTGTVSKLAIWASNPLITFGQTALAEASNVSFTSGNFTDESLVESELATGSINALEAETTYYMSIVESDDNPYWVIPFQITVE